ncbi:hypothetical protein WA026_001248 [Henosepilachna vigintioctopunctata]|uniref:MD-2-related lipid-recognition domain-containing protein n=1 Tax=Henosepilachna vigintioctopunctata TaxID=420089 RepID=A0AAW1USW4_9CUCU
MTVLILKAFILASLFCIDFIQARKIFHINKWQNCRDYTNLAIVLIQHKQHNYAENNRSTEQIFEVKKHISGNISGTTTLTKCNLSGAPDTCEFFIKDLKYSGVCVKMNEKRQAWTPFVESFVPKLACPIKPGTYASKIYFSNASFMRFFPVPSGIWRARWILSIENEVILCQDFEWRVVDVRRS